MIPRPLAAGSFITEFFSTLPGYTGSNVQERPEEAEKEACLTLRNLEQLFVAYLVNRYNRGLDARMGDQTRIERWEAGLLKPPPVLSERELDICLMKQTRRIIYRGGYLQFENLTYQNDELAAHAGETVVLRYDPRDITHILVYRREAEHDAQGALLRAKETFLAPAIAQDLETEKLSLEEAQANSRRIREQGKAVDNQSMLDEIHDREAFVEQRKKSRRERQKEEQTCIQPQPKSKSKTTVIPQLTELKPGLKPEPELSEEVEMKLPQFTVWDFDDED